MKKPIAFGKFVFFFAAIQLLAVVSLFAQTAQPWSQNTSPLPPSTGFVNDFAGVIDASTKQQLEAKLKNLKETTNPSVEIAVAVVKTTGERDIFDYSLAVARGWKIGSKDDDNPSALLFVAIDDRKYYTQVSKDLEDELPDGLAGSLQRQYLVPEFKKGNYAKGIADTIDAYIKTTQDKANGTATPQKPVAGRDNATGGGTMSGLFCCCLILFIILLIIFTRSKGGPTNGDRNRWGGGGFGGGSGAAGNIVSGILGGIIGSGLSGGSSASGWGGSSDSGGGGWGGFGGGGDFGGGGAGGDW